MMWTMIYIYSTEICSFLTNRIYLSKKMVFITNPLVDSRIPDWLSMSLTTFAGLDFKILSKGRLKLVATEWKCSNEVASNADSDESDCRGMLNSL
jgi:hypothetical protein